MNNLLTYLLLRKQNDGYIYLPESEFEKLMNSIFDEMTNQFTNPIRKYDTNIIYHIVEKCVQERYGNDMSQYIHIDFLF